MWLYLARDRRQSGPYSEEEVRAMRAAGEISGDEPAWHEGLSEWVPLESLLPAETRDRPPVPEGLPPLPPVLQQPVRDIIDRTRGHPSYHTGIAGKDAAEGKATGSTSVLPSRGTHGDS